MSIRALGGAFVLVAAAQTSSSTGGRDYAALMLGWLVPGLGHYLVGDRKRALIFAVAIHLLFFMGLLLGGVRALDRPRQPLWDYSQYAAGWPTLVGVAIRNRVDPALVPTRRVNSLGQTVTQMLPPPDAGRPVGFAPIIQGIATAYCGLAGWLNLLVLVDLFMRVSEPSPAVPPTAAGGGAHAA
ncbi:MAG: DUF6677 family protein [Phycisphaerae bacterium]